MGNCLLFLLLHQTPFISPTASKEVMPSAPSPLPYSHIVEWLWRMASISSALLGKSDKFKAPSLIFNLGLLSSSSSHNLNGKAEYYYYRQTAMACPDSQIMAGQVLIDVWVSPSPANSGRVPAHSHLLLPPAANTWKHYFWPQMIMKKKKKIKIIRI